MPSAQIPFPRSSMPGQNPGEGQGRLINAYCEIDAGKPTWRPVPGTETFVTLPTTSPRGMIVVDDILYVAHGNTVKSITVAGVITSLTGQLRGTGPVTWALNNAENRDIICVTNDGCFVVTETSVTEFSDPDLPVPNSVVNFDGYFLFTIGDGLIYASDLNSTAIDPLSFTGSDANPDSLLRGTVNGGQFFAWGETSCEVFQNAGTSPFPLVRATVIPVGLYGPWAIAGNQQGWDSDQVFVAADGTVRQLKGYEPVYVSTKDVERDIQSITDKNSLHAMVYVFDGHPIWSLSSPTWTWEYNLVTGYWHERRDLNTASRWFGETSVFFNSNWIIGKNGSGKLLTVDSGVYEDDGDPIEMTLESGPLKDFPMRAVVNSAFFDWTTGSALLTGTEDETNPKVYIQWSRDGGGTWSNAVFAESLGAQGELSRQIRVNRVGLASHHGMRFRLLTTSPIYKTCRGGIASYTPRGPA